MTDIDDTDAGQAAVDAAWLAEISRRVDKYTSGEAKLTDADEHFVRIRAKLAAHAQ